MTTITLAYAEQHKELAQQIREDLQGAGYTVSEGPGVGPLVALLAPNTLTAVEPAIYAAHDQHQHIIPALVQPMPLPDSISNLPVLKLYEGYNSHDLLVEVNRLTAPDAPQPLTVLTPTRQAANRRTALWVAVPVVIMFFAALIGIILNITLPPTDEFAALETRDFEMRNYEIDRALPRSTEEAAVFEATLDHFSQKAQPVIILTVTGIAGYSESTHFPRSTEDATNFPATLEQVSTIVQERMAATVTQLAAEAANITPTPEPSSGD